MAYVSNPPKAEWDFRPVRCSGIIREYAPKLKAFEHVPAENLTEDTDDPTSVNTLLFIGGLGDDILFPQYVNKRLVPAIYGDDGLAGWRIVEVSISSSGNGWGTGSVERVGEWNADWAISIRDAEELSKCVYYHKALRPNGKIVMMGHSTGCQDIFYLMTRFLPTPPVDGIILQAPISDREAFTPIPPAATLFTIANSLVNPLASEDRPNAPGGRTILPIEITSQIFGWHTPISANRWFSLTAPPDIVTGKPMGEEDFFSSDFSEDVIRKYTFGRLRPGKAKVLLLYSEEDEWVPSEVDKSKLVGTWMKVMKEKGVRVDEQNSGVVEKANHDLMGLEESVMQDILGRVKRFLGWIAEEDMEDSG